MRGPDDVMVAVMTKKFQRCFIFFFEFPFIPFSFVLSFSGQPTGSDIPEPVDYPEVQDAMIVYKCNLH